MSKIKWIKLETMMFQDDKISIIESLPDGDAILLIWIKLILLAGTKNSNGYIFLSEDIPYTEDMLAIIFKKSVSQVRLALNTFEKFGMIQIDQKGICLVNFNLT